MNKIRGYNGLEVKELNLYPSERIGDVAGWHKRVYKPKQIRKNFDAKYWRNLRNRVIKRDKRKCKLCGTNLNLTVHHIISRKEGGKDVMKNLETLCTVCHDKIEMGEDVSVIEKLEIGIDWHEWVYGGMRQPKYCLC